jgi:hypothetical protein
VSNATGSYEVYVQIFADPARGKWIVSKNSGTLPRRRSNGKELLNERGVPAPVLAVEVTTVPQCRAGAPAPLTAARNAG